MIVPMKKAKLFFMDQESKRVLKILQLHGLIMPDSQYLQQSNPSLTLIETQKAISIIEKYLKKKSFGNNEVFNKDEFIEINDKSIQDVKNILSIQDDLLMHEDILKSLEEEKKKITPFETFDIPIKNISMLTNLLVVMGKINIEKKDNFLGAIQSLDLYFDEVSLTEHEAYLAIAVLKEDYEKLSSIIRQSGFIVETFNLYDAKFSEVLINLNEKIQQEKKAIKEAKEKLESNIDKLPQLKLLHDQLLSDEKLNEIKLNSTETTKYIEGWIRSDQVDLLKRLLDDEKIAYELDLRDPLKEELSPTALKNNTFVQPFESITNQFSIPNPKEMDPNPMMSFWYWIIFGIMMGDMGYGLSMVIIFGLALKFLKLKGTVKDLAKIFLFTGFTAILAGLMFGSFFGITVIDKPLLDPINDPVPMLIVSIGIGIVHIICALVMKFIYCIREKDILSGLNDAVSWILILLGISLYASTIAGIYSETMLPIINYLSIGMILLGALIIVLLNGRNSKSIAGKLVGAFTGLYGSTSYLSDILSYSRILALALSSGVIAYTFNLLGGMVWNSIPILGYVLGLLIFIVGHVFNFIMGLLSAYVHAGRLQYLEYYGKFYEGGGFLFEPLQLQLKYVYQVNLEDRKNK